MTLGVLRERPTALQPADDTAGPVRVSTPAEASASAAAGGRGSLPEDVLIAGGLGLGRPAIRVEACVCGGSIEAEDTDPAIAAAVRAHNASPGHARRAIAGGWRHG